MVKKYIRATCFANFPWISDCVNRNLSDCDREPSLELDYFVQVAEVGGFTPVIAPLSENNQSTDALIHALATGYTDMICSLLSIHELGYQFQNVPILSATSPIMEDYPVFILSEKIFGRVRKGIVLSISQKSLWILSALVFVACVLLKKITSEYFPSLKRIGNISLVVQGYITVLLLGVYSNYLTVALSITTDSVPFRDLSDFIHKLETKECSILQSNYWYQTAFGYSIFGNLENDTEKQYYIDLLRANTETVANFSELSEKIRTSSSHDCFIGLDWNYAYMMNKDHTCGLIVYTAEFVSKRKFSYFLRKNFQYYDDIMNIFLSASSSQHFNQKAEAVRAHITKTYGTPCFSQNDSKRPLNMRDYQDVFGGFLFLSVSCVCLFFYEKIVKRFGTNRKTLKIEANSNAPFSRWL